MSQETTAAEQSMQQGNNAQAAKLSDQELPGELVRDPIYAMVYVGGLVVYGLLIALFLV
jgi:hypothetical protein